MNVMMGGDHLTASPAQCECRCGPAEGIECASSALIRRYDHDDSCSSATAAYPLSAGCQPLPSPVPVGAHWALDPPEIRGGSCAPELTEAVDEPRFAVSGLVCARTAPDLPCDHEGLCAPTPEQTPLCLWRDGDQSCPEHWDTSRWVYYRSYADSRGCSSCSCDTPAGECSAPEVILFAQICNPPISAVLTQAVPCVGPPSGPVVSALYRPGAAEGTCTPAPVQPTGVVALDDAFTVCCGS